jgi:hypothetical protein
MKKITKEQFYKILIDNKLNYYNYSDYNNKQIMTTEFKIIGGELFGISIHDNNKSSDTYGQVTYEIEDKWLNLKGE